MLIKRHGEPLVCSRHNILSELSAIEKVLGDSMCPASLDLAEHFEDMDWIIELTVENHPSRYNCLNLFRV